MLRRIYLSPAGFLITVVLWVVALLHKPFMVYGYYNRTNRKFLKQTRIGSTVKLVNKEKINLSDQVWIGHYALIDGVGGVTIGKGVHISSHTVIYSHSSQDAIRLMGEHYLRTPINERKGYKIKPVSIGEYTFIGTNSIILPGSVIGKGCIIGAGSVINGIVPEFAIVSGNPFQIIGDTRERDRQMFGDVIDASTYYDPGSLRPFKP